MDTTTVSPSNGEDQADETTETTSATAGTDVGKTTTFKVDDSGTIHTVDDTYEPVEIRVDDTQYKDQTSIDLYTVIEVQAMLRLTRRGVYQWIRTHIRPIGGIVRVGKRNLIHKWALNAVLKQMTWDHVASEKQRRGMSRNRYIPSKTKLTRMKPE